MAKPTVCLAARALAPYFHEHGINLVYGGGTTGLMGELARTLVSLSGPSAVEGIIPAPLMAQEQRAAETVTIMHEGRQIAVPDEAIYGTTTVVPDMHSRKREMARRVELMEVVTWNQVGIHDRPVVVFNVEGYYDGVLAWIRDAVEAGFVREGQKDILVEARTAEECGTRLREYAVSDGRLDLKWGAH
ncbi:hypothetical protein VE04_02402 [Pseudogymnoascus sp. 24MN13]|nr:hypothetical protein VE04_02402 [Pseudogymnoascus sp. 24MN13]